MYSTLLASSNPDPALTSMMVGFGVASIEAAVGTMKFCVDLEGARVRLAKLNKRAKRLGLEEVGFVEVGSHVEHCFTGSDPFTGQPYYEWSTSKTPSTGMRLAGEVRTVHHMVLSATELTLSGWSFLAVLDHELGEDNTVVRLLPSAEGKLPTDWKHRNNACDHCKRSQARKQTYVVAHEDGRLMQVGSTCIRDFLGHEVAKVLGQVDICGSLGGIFDEDEYYGGARRTSEWDTVEYLAWVAKTIRECGWISRGAIYQGKAVGMATADTAQSDMFTYQKQRQS